MKISNFLKSAISLLAIMFIITGCGTREPKTPQHLTGMEKNAEWKQYNEYAEKNDFPVLDFMATTIMYKFGDGAVPNYEFFPVTDPRVTIQTKWHNSKITDDYEFKFYMPDGRLFVYQYMKPKKAENKWTIGRNIFLQGMPTEEIQGKWTVEVYANKKYVTKKSFIIGMDQKVAKVTPKLKIAFSPYWNSEDSTWSHSRDTPVYLSSALLRDNKNISIVPATVFLREVGNPQFDFKNFDEQLKSDLNDSAGLIPAVIKKIDADYLIGGKVKSTWTGENQETIYTTYIIDAKKGKIIDTIETKHYLGRSLINVKSKGMHPSRIKVYKALYEDIKNRLMNLK